MKLFAIALSVALLATSTLSAPVNSRKQCRPKIRSSASLVAISTVPITTSEAAPTSSVSIVTSVAQAPSPPVTSVTEVLSTPATSASEEPSTSVTSVSIASAPTTSVDVSPSLSTVATSTSIVPSLSAPATTVSAAPSLSTLRTSTSDAPSTSASATSVDKEPSTSVVSVSTEARSTLATSVSKPPATTVTTSHEASPTTKTTVAPTTSSASPTPTPPPPSSGSGIKRGVSYNDASLIQDFSTSKVSWAYNWDSAKGGNLPSGVNYFPMLWSGASDHTNDWMANAKAAIAQGSTHLLFINEPDISSQANTDPVTAAQQWMQYMQPFAGQATLVSPAITNGPPPSMGTGWMDSFIAECEKLGCQVDAIAGHIYADPTDPSYYETYITSLGQRYSRPVLMTEIGVSSGSDAQQQALIEQLVPFLDGLDSVSHYAWFMAGQGILVNADGSLTSLGQTYESS